MINLSRIIRRHALSFDGERCVNPAFAVGAGNTRVALIGNAPPQQQQGGGGGGSGYTAHAVKIDNWNGSDNGLTVSSLSIADTALITLSLWFLSPSSPGLASTFPNLFGMPSGTTWGGIGGDGSVNFFLEDTARASSLNINSASGVVTNNAWHHLFMSANTNAAAGSKLKNLYLDGASIYNAGNSSDTSAAFNIGVNGKPFGVPEDAADLSSDSTLLALSDVWIAIGQYVDPSQITKFRTTGGQPVSLGANGATPTGVAPTFFFTGNAASFKTNAGSGPAVTLNGSITDYGSAP